MSRGSWHVLLDLFVDQLGHLSHSLLREVRLVDKAGRAVFENRVDIDGGHTGSPGNFQRRRVILRCRNSSTTKATERFQCTVWSTAPCLSVVPPRYGLFDSNLPRRNSTRTQTHNSAAKPPAKTVARLIST